MLTEEGIGSLKKRHCNVPRWFSSRSPHPPVSTGTFSPWEKDGAGCQLLPPRMRCSLLAPFRHIHHPANFLQHPINPLIHLAVAKSQFNKASLRNCSTARAVISDALIMLLAVNLDGEPRFNAAEVSYVTCNDFLPSKLQALKPSPTQTLPQFLFS